MEIKTCFQEITHWRVPGYILESFFYTNMVQEGRIKGKHLPYRSLGSSCCGILSAVLTWHLMLK